MDLQALLNLSIGKKQFANPRRIALLEQIAVTGSISQGAKLAGISYKAAWDAVKDMNSALSQPVVHSEKGGKGGGGAKLTEFGERLLKVYSITAQVQGMALEALLDDTIAMNSLLDVMAHFSLNTSARNQLTGRICNIESFGLNDHITVVLAGGQKIETLVTHASAKKLQLVLNKSILLLFKAPIVTMTTSAPTKSLQNCLCGQLISTNKLGDNVEMTLDIGGNDKVHSVMPISQLVNINLKLAETYYGCFEFNQVIIASMR
ncbi:MAG: LysR family transcriptional regulator [Aliivibrio sp.]|uniref:TOBE domain-containing protein n=1 Tax=Aliivibrio sp. TaxID=1872443 RepID=UPI001A452C7F|nr:LysR family transcriptional regulator [Aliivibrio sp.]